MVRCKGRNFSLCPLLTAGNGMPDALVDKQYRHRHEPGQP